MGIATLVTFLTLNQGFDVQSSRHVDIGQSFTLSIIHTVAADHPLKHLLFDKTVSFFFLPTPKHPIKTDVHPIVCIFYVKQIIQW